MGLCLGYDFLVAGFADCLTSLLWVLGRGSVCMVWAVCFDLVLVLMLLDGVMLWVNTVLLYCCMFEFCWFLLCCIYCGRCDLCVHKFGVGLWTWMGDRIDIVCA